MPLISNVRHQMNAATLSALGQLNDLRHAALEALKAKHKYPALLLFYSFIDICAAISDETNERRNRTRFESFLRKYATLSNWSAYSTYDLWAARSSLLHTYSPLGDHTEPGKGARPIFYFAWPETKEEVDEALSQRGYQGYLLIDAETIKFVATDCFNSMWHRVENDPSFETLVADNARNLLKDVDADRKLTHLER